MTNIGQKVRDFSLKMGDEVRRIFNCSIILSAIFK